MNLTHIPTVRRLLVAAMTLGAVWSNSAMAENCASCQASGLSAYVAVAATASTVVASGTLVVESVEKVSDGVVIVFKGVSQAGKTSIKLSGQAAGAVSVTAGSVVQATAISAGIVLVAAGQVLAFIPNEIGASLVHQSRVE